MNKRWQWIALVVLLAFAADWFIQRPDARSRALDSVIEQTASDALKDYPYRFHVLRVEGDVAVMATPRNFDVPAMHFIAAIEPGIDVRDPQNPAFIAAQARLAAAQSEARSIVEAQPGIASVRWELDRNWLTAHGIDVPPQ
ncbi:MAG: hypothetical protein KDH17_11715 [Rhodocyclaceae bacterium]|nr:hypothetical protein [Rhodocyclaceae bacterium]